ncbi:DUF1173 family protein [Actinoallomurus sp. NPDC052274]|uniref:DUF1173 family protein n=1 Tax=Actinoallomurus sp. NPDC052274 TaxID=3155420 RepID=UPI0034333E6C
MRGRLPHTGNGDSGPSPGDPAGRVRLGDETVSLATLRHFPERFAKLFARARAEVGYGECLCTAPPLRLVIRARAGRYHLACWPGEGERHATDCDFHKTDPGFFGRSGYSDQAIAENEDGVAIRLDTPLLVRRDAPHDGTSTEAFAGNRRRTVGLLGLLHYLWEQAELVTWRPTWHTCHARLSEYAAQCSINGVDLPNVLYIVPPYRPEQAARNAAAFQAFYGRLGGRGRNGGD